VNTTEGGFQSRVQALIEERFGHATAYAYCNRPRGSPSPRVAESTIKQWLQAKEPCMPSIDRLVAFAAEMGVTLDYLVLGRVEGDLATDLRAYLVDSLSRRVAARPYDRPQTVRFFEGFLPRGQALLDAVETVTFWEIKTSHQERWERTRTEALQLLSKRLNQARDRKTRRKLERQIVAGVRAQGEVPLLLDEGPEASPGAFRASPWEGRNAKGEASVRPVIRRSLRARATNQRAGEPARRAARIGEAERELERRLQERGGARKQGDRARKKWADERVKRARERLKRLRAG